MAHKKKHGGGPVPAGNQPQSGPPEHLSASAETNTGTRGEARFQEQDPKRRIGDFEGTAEHSFQQPGGKNDANH
jgi:hypothetical protein